MEESLFNLSILRRQRLFQTRRSSAARRSTLGTAGWRYTSGVLGNLPHDLVGIAGDYVKYKRLKRAVELEQE